MVKMKCKTAEMKKKCKICGIRYSMMQFGSIKDTCAKCLQEQGEFDEPYPNY